MELEKLRRHNARLQRRLDEYHPDNSYRDRFEDLARARNSLPAEPGVEASLVQGVWNDQPVRDDGHMELGMMNFRYVLTFSTLLTLTPKHLVLQTRTPPTKLQPGVLVE